MSDDVVDEIQPQSLPSIRLKWSIALIVVAILLTFNTVSHVRNSPPISVTDTVGKADIYFSSNHEHVLLPSDCVMLEWDVEGIQSVYLVSQGVDGQGSSQWCLSEGKSPSLHVNFTDNTSKQYILNLGYQIPVLEAIYVVLLFGMSLYLLRAPLYSQAVDYFIRHEKRRSYLIGVWILGIMFLYWLANGRTGLSTFNIVTGKMSQVLSDYFYAPWQG